MRIVNLALRFMLELCMLIALGQWGLRTGDSLLAKILLGLGAPLAAAVIWGLFVAPRALRRAGDPARLVLELGIFGLAVAALLAVGRTLLAGLFALAIVTNEALLQAWGQRGQA